MREQEYNRRKKSRLRIACLLLAGLLWLGGCGRTAAVSETASEAGETAAGGAEAGETAAERNAAGDTEAVKTTAEKNAVGETAAGDAAEEASLAGLSWEASLPLEYAQNFSVDYYEGGHTLLTTHLDGERFLVVPEGKKAPEGLEEEISVIRRPVENLYLVSSSVMDIFAELDGLGSISFSGQEEDGWYIEEARKAMAAGDIVYAGKYNRPDYELLVSGNCSLAIENMMISHSPEVAEKLESFGIPVIVEGSSYESHPLGRVEWVKFFGALLGKEEEAEEIFTRQTDILERVSSEKQSGKTVAFFYITSNGLVQVRCSTDYVPKMIELAGGTYVFENLGDPETRRSTMNMQMEEFYKGAKDADYIIYNSSIDGGVSNVDELLEKCPLLADFKAVQEGNAWCTTNDLYQQSLSIGYLIGDIHAMLMGEGEEGMSYLFHLE